MHQLVSFVKFFEVFREGFLKHSLDASADVYAIVTCLTKKFQELAIGIGNLKPFVLDRTSVMTGRKRRCSC